MDSGVLTRHAYTATDMINGYKVLECRIRQQHDWSQCFYAHPQERARRRSLQKYSYAAVLCPDVVSTGSCKHGDACNKSHSVFEFWLHPDKYCTRMCYDGVACTRPFCFFAHAPRELRTSRGGSDTRVRQKLMTTKLAQAPAEQQQHRLQAAAAAAPEAVQAVPGVAAHNRDSSSNSWQGYALPASLASSRSSQDEVASPAKHKSDKSAGGGSSTSSSSRTSASSGTCGSDGGSGSSDNVAGSSADVALLQQLQLQLKYEACSRGTSPTTETEKGSDAVLNSVQALLSCLSLEASFGQVTESALVEAAAPPDAPAAAAAVDVAPDCQTQQQVQPRRCVSDSMLATDNTTAVAELVRMQPAQHWPPAVPATPTDICHSRRSSSNSSCLHASNVVGSLWGSAAAAAAAESMLLPALMAEAGCMSGRFSEDTDASSSSSNVLASIGSQPSLTSFKSLTLSTAVDPADSVLDEVAPLGLFGAVQPRAAHKQQQQQQQ